jgi:hypothetical protein
LAIPAFVLVEVEVVGSARSAPLILVAPAARHLVAIRLAVDLTGESGVTLNRAKRAVEQVVPGSTVRIDVTSKYGLLAPEDLPFDSAVLDSRPGRINDDVSVTRVVLVDGPRKPIREFRPGTIVLGVDEWCRLVRETSQPGRPASTTATGSGWCTWAHWRSNWRDRPARPMRGLKSWP